MLGINILHSKTNEVMTKYIDLSYITTKKNRASQDYEENKYN